LIPKILNSGFVDVDIIIKSIMIGYLSHLVIDLFTEEGLPLLFPIKIKIGIPPISHLRIHTGGWAEKWLIFPGIIILMGWIVVTKWGVLKAIIF
jgi:membrane-bound metal-dependent hydrolase YbcI (DUF457 family)